MVYLKRSYTRGRKRKEGSWKREDKALHGTKNGTKLTSLQWPVEDGLHSPIILMPWVTRAGKKKWLPRSGACHACRGLFSNSAEMCLDEFTGKSRSWKCGDYNLFYKDRIAQGRHLPSVPCQCIETRKTTESGWQAVQMPEKEEEPARQDHLGQEGSHLNETGWKDECWQALCRQNCEGGCC